MPKLSGWVQWMPLCLCTSLFLPQPVLFCRFPTESHVDWDAQLCRVIDSSRGQVVQSCMMKRTGGGWEDWAQKLMQPVYLNCLPQSSSEVRLWFVGFSFPWGEQSIYVWFLDYYYILSLNVTCQYTVVVDFCFFGAHLQWKHIFGFCHLNNKDMRRQVYAPLSGKTSRSQSLYLCCLPTQKKIHENILKFLDKWQQRWLCIGFIILLQPACDTYEGTGSHQECSLHLGWHPTSQTHGSAWLS